MLEKEQRLSRSGQYFSVKAWESSSCTVNISNNNANSGKAAKAKSLHL